jgi:hypothetical protein
MTWLILLAIATLSILSILSACAGKTALPPPPPPAVEVLVPVVQPCEPRKVERSILPSAAGLVGDIYEDVKRILADREVLKADRELLVAANTHPCPKVTP